MLLAIDCSGDAGSVALLGPAGPPQLFALEGLRSHARALAPAVEAALERAGGLAAIERYAISIGPGSFTGLRIGLSLLKGLAFVHPAPIAAVSTLAALAAAAPGEGVTLALIGAQGSRVFAGLYDRQGARLALDARLPDGLYEQTELTDRLAGVALGQVAGDARALKAPPPLGATILELSPSAAEVARLGAAALQGPARLVELSGLEPAYLQRSAVEERLGLRAEELG